MLPATRFIDDGPPPSPALRRIFIPFLSALLLFRSISLLGIQLMSDCALPGLLGYDACSDDIVRAGWPLQCCEEGGLASHSFFSAYALVADLAAGLAGAILPALGGSRLRKVP